LDEQISTKETLKCLFGLIIKGGHVTLQSYR